MAQKAERKVVTNYEGFVRTHEGVKGFTVKGKFFSFDEILGKLEDGDTVKFGVVTDIDVEGGEAIFDDEEEDEE